MWPTCIGLATFGELKSMTTFFGARGLLEKQMFAARGARAFPPARGFSRKLRKPAPAIPVSRKCRETSSLARNPWRAGADSFPRLGQRHERIGLVIAEFRVGARTDEHGGDIGIGQNGADGILQMEFNLFVGQARKSFNHGWARMDTDKI